MIRFLADASLHGAIAPGAFVVSRQSTSFQPIRPLSTVFPT
jgi:hypothetical protein